MHIYNQEFRDLFKLVEKILSQLIIYNPLDLTKQIINILKENNFCRIGGSPKKSIKRKTIKPITKQK